jgi:type IX secretion system PorP/SprF family membrane protein
MRKLLIVLSKIICIFTLNFSYSSAQNTTRIQAFANPLNLNPAFTGFSQNPRIGSQYLNYYEGDFILANLNYDQHVDFLKGGIGISTNYISSHNGGFTTLSIAGLYAFEFKIGDNAGISAGINASFNQHTLNIAKFYRDINTSFGAENITKSYFNLEAGILGYNSNFYGGFSIQNIPEPTAIYSDRFKTIATRIYNTQMGGFIHLSENFNKGWMLNPYLMYSSVSPPDLKTLQLIPRTHLISAGLNVSKSFITVGTKYFVTGNYNALDGSFGVNIGKLKLGYGTRLWSKNNFFNSMHELSCVFYFNKPKDISDNKMVNNLRRIF